MKISVLGAGSWGTALAYLLSGKGFDVALWAREKKLANQISENRENSWFLPEIKLPANLRCSSDMQKVNDSAELIVLAVPCQFISSVLSENENCFPRNPTIVCASKGVEVESLKPMSQVVSESLSSLDPIYTVLSGPSFAREVSQNLPTAVSLGCADEKQGHLIQNILSTQFFRVYSNPDVRGVELGGALKNIMAIAAGISDGLGFGTSARAALITRGLAEMSRLGAAMGARRETFMGLSGMGDLVLTCTGDLSRNRQVGLKIGQGKSLEKIISNMKMVAEGVKTTQAVSRLAAKMAIELPITLQVYEILYKNKDPRLAFQELMTRTLKPEQ